MEGQHYDLNHIRPLRASTLDNEKPKNFWSSIEAFFMNGLAKIFRKSQIESNTYRPSARGVENLKYSLVKT